MKRHSFPGTPDCTLRFGFGLPTDLLLADRPASESHIAHVQGWFTCTRRRRQRSVTKGCQMPDPPFRSNSSPEMIFRGSGKLFSINSTIEIPLPSHSGRFAFYRSQFFVPQRPRPGSYSPLFLRGPATNPYRHSPPQTGSLNFLTGSWQLC